MQHLTSFLPLLLGVVVSLVIEGFKRLPQIPLSEGQTVKLRTAAAILSYLGALGTAVASKDASTLDLLANTLVAWLTSHMSYKSFLAGKSGLIPTPPQDTVTE